MTWLLRLWRRLRGRCPCCAARLFTSIWFTRYSRTCGAGCGWWRDYAMDGSAFEHWPEHAP